jgi:hypothetical protein
MALPHKSKKETLILTGLKPGAVGPADVGEPLKRFILLSKL